MRNTFTFAILFSLWCVLSGQFDAFHLGLGVFSCAVVTVLTSHYLYGNQRFGTWRALQLGCRLVPYALWLLKEIFLANVHVFRLSMFPGGLRLVEPEIITFRTRLTSPFARYLLANSITLTPGTVTLKLKDAEFSVHSISAKTTAGLEGEMEDRIARAFGQTLDGEISFRVLGDQQTENQK